MLQCHAAALPAAVQVMPPGTNVDAFSCGFVLGVSRSLACIVCLEALISLSIPVADMLATERGSRLLSSFKYIHVTYTPVDGAAQLGFRVVLSKMRGSERQRPDPLQLARVFSETARLEQSANPNMAWDEAVTASILKYNKSTSVRSASVESDERLAVRLVMSQTAGFQAALERCWKDVKVREGPVTVTLLAKSFLREPRPAKDKAENPLWWEILSPSPAKNEEWIRRVIGAWESRVSRASAAAGKQVNLKSRPVSAPA